MYAPPVVGAVPCTPAEVLRAWSYAVRVLNVQVSLTCHLGSQTKFNEQQRYLVRTNMRSLLSGTQDAVAFPTEPRVRRLVDRFCFGFVQVCCGLGGAAVLCLRHSSKRGFTSWHLYYSACRQKAQRSVSANMAHNAHMRRIVRFMLSIMPAPLHTPLTLAASFGAGLVASVPHSITPC